MGARFKFKDLGRKKYMVAAAALAVLAIGGGVTKALLLGGGGSPVSSGDIELQRGLVGEWKLDGNAKDSTPYANDGTVTSATLASDREGQANSAYSFSGTSGQKINLPGTGPYDNFGTSSFTVSSWIKTTEADTQNCIFSTAGGTKGFRFGFQSGEPYYLVGDGTNYHEGTIGTTTLDNGSWHHLVIVYAYSSSWNLTAYIDGASVGSVNPGATIGSVNDTYANMGSMTGSGTNGTFAGSIDDVRVYNRALSAGGVSALYNEYDPGIKLLQSESGLVGHWKLDGNAKDSSPYGNNGTANNVTPTTDRKGQSNGAYNFSGSSTSNVVMSGVSNFPSTAITNTFWIKTSVSGSRYIVSYSPNGGNDWLIGQPNNLQVYRGSPITTGVSVADGSWHFVAVTWQSSNGQAQVYKDGVLAFNGTLTGAALSQTGCLVLGQDQDSLCGGFDSAQALDGSLDDVRIYSRVLSAGEIMGMYNTYDSAIGVGGAPGASGSGVQLGSGLVGDWEFNGNAHDSTPYGNNGTVTGATLTVDRLGRPNSAYSFDGSTSYIRVATLASAPSSTMSICTWIKTSATSGDIMQLGRNGTDANTEFMLYISSGKLAFWDYTSGYGFNGGSTGTISSSSIANSLWHLGCFIKNSTSGTFYIDGVPDGTSTAALNASYSSNDFVLGEDYRSNNNFFGGSLDGVRIYNRALSAAEVTALYNLYN